MPAPALDAVEVFPHPEYVLLHKAVALGEALGGRQTGFILAHAREAGTTEATVSLLQYRLGDEGWEHFGGMAFAAPFARDLYAAVAAVLRGEADSPAPPALCPEEVNRTVLARRLLTLGKKRVGVYLVAKDAYAEGVMIRVFKRAGGAWSPGAYETLPRAAAEHLSQAAAGFFA